VFHVFPSNVIAGRPGQVADKLTLGPAVAFPEGMQRVQFAEIMRRAIAERGRVESGKVFFLGHRMQGQGNGHGRSVGTWLNRR
jgi:hypothetical protein